MSNETANHVFCDAHELHRGVLHVQNVAVLHGTRVSVISLTLISKATAFRPAILTKVKHSRILCLDVAYRISTRSDRNQITTLSKVWLPMCRFSPNSQPLNNILWISPVPNFIQIRRKRIQCGQNYISRLSEARLPVRQFSRNYRPFNSIKRKLHAPNFT